MQDYSNKPIDMATMIKNVKPFKGESNEDVNIWIRDVMFLGEGFGWTEDELKRALVLSLKEKALSWASQVLKGKLGMISLEELIMLLKKRFGANQNNDITLSKFISSGIPGTGEEYSNMLKKATLIYERNLINLGALCQMVINKSPAEVKSSLFHSATNADSWEKFIQDAEEVAWISYPDKMLSRVEANNGTFGRGPANNGSFGRGLANNGNTKYCALHEEGQHYTRDCIQFSAILRKEKEKLKGRKVNVVAEENSEDNIQEENKNISFYAYRVEDNGNPFFVHGTLYEKLRKILLDTGADVSIIDKKDVPPHLVGKIKDYSGIVKGAGSEILKIVGKLNHCIIRINDEEIIFSPLVMENARHVILGTDVIKNNTGLISNVLRELNKRKQKEFNQVHLLTEESIKKDYDDIFKTEIGEFNLCTAGKHSIKISTDKIICQRNGRIAVAQEEAIETEIEKLLRLGIIRPSRSPWCSRIVMVPRPDKSWRMCVDYRGLNKITVRDRYMSPRIDEIFDRLANASVFSVLDATCGFQQFPVEEEDKDKTAFSFKGQLYEYNRMPFGLCNAPATFQRAMD